MDRPDNTSTGSRGGPERPPSQKTADAFRTIGEVADELKLPQHVLRFWETRFPQIKPLKRAGGRRFYRPEDVALLRAVQALLYAEGYTIKGVQRLFGEFGARQVAEALARSVRLSGEGDGRPGDPDHDEGTDTAMPDDGPTKRSAAAEAVPRPTPPRAEAAGLPRPAPRAGSDPHLLARLEEVLAELAECGRLLSALRSTRN